MHWDTFKQDNYCTVGKGGGGGATREVGSVRYKVVLLSPCLTIRVLSYSNC